MANHHLYFVVGNETHYGQYLNQKQISPMLYYNTFIKKDGMYGGKLYKYKNYDFMVTKTKDEDRTTFFIGNKRKCLIATLYKGDDTVNIQSFGYYSDCSIGQNMARGVETDGVMYTFIHYIRKKYKDIVKKITLTDNAYFECKNYRIKMNIYYFFKYGEQYYSKKYNF